MRRFNLGKLEDILSHAIGTVPFYIKNKEYILNNGGGLHSYPIINRNDICGKENEFLSSRFPVNSLTHQTTSGSTGIPVKCFKSHSDATRSGRLLWKCRNWFGKVYPNDKYAIFFLRRFNTDRTINSSPCFVNGNQLNLSVLDLSPERLELYCEALEAFNPNWIFGPPSALYYLAKHIEKRKWSINIPNLKFIEVTGEYSDTEQRKYISSVFKCAVTNMYGSKEIWVIAYSCPNGHLHIVEDNVIVEFLSTENSGRNEVVITGLNNYAMPIIRYRIGDTGKFVDHHCLFPGRIIELSGGRIGQYFLYNNKTLSTSNFYMAVYDLDRKYPGTIAQFQFRQIGNADFEFMYIPGVNFQTGSLNYLEELLYNTFGNMLNITFTCTDFIPYSSSGKLSYFVDARNQQ